MAVASRNSTSFSPPPPAPPLPSPLLLLFDTFWCQNALLIGSVAMIHKNSSQSVSLCMPQLEWHRFRFESWIFHVLRSDLWWLKFYDFGSLTCKMRGSNNSPVGLWRRLKETMHIKCIVKYCEVRPQVSAQYDVLPWHLVKLTSMRWMRRPNCKFHTPYTHA